MVCPSCQTEAPPGANFCPACGTKLAAACARCGGQLPPGARFCPSCGSPAAGAESGRAGERETGRGALPRSPALPLSRSPADTELRLVTVLFADVHGFTTLSERLSPEAITELMNRCFGSVIPEITRFGGTVDKYVGDAVMARFGAPVAHEDDPERAIHAALGMQRALARLGSELALGPGLELRMRIGINTGPVLAGEVGAETHREYTLMGDAVNVASRLEHECPLGGVLVGETTYRLAWRAFRFDSPRPLELRGKSAPVNAYLVLGEAGAGPEQPSGQAAPLVGRIQELALLSEAAERASAGQGQVVLVLGEPGVGKSRLLAELRSRLERPNGGLAFALARCQSYRQNVAYAALGQLLRSAAGLETVGEPATGSELAPSTSSGRAVASAAERLEAWLTGLFGQVPQGAERAALVREALLDLLGLRPQPEAEQLEPHQRQARLARAFKDLVAALGARSPLALVVEDLHWIDESSLDVLDELVDALPGLPVLLLTLSRPERLPPWVGRSWYRQVTLSPLQGEQGHELLSALLAGWEVSPGLAQRLLERTGGNPFFLEEVVASLREAGALQVVDGQWALADERRAALPATVQEVLLARLDRLERPVRAVLQTASVIGRSFAYRLLRSVSEADGALDDALRTLRRHEFVFESVLGGPEPLYSFKHAITQEVVYSSLLRTRRRELHLRVAAELERAPGDGAEPPHALLAHHYLQAEAWERALPNLLEAARSAKQRYANEEALALFGQALEILERAADPSASSGQAVAELEPGAARLAIFDLLSERQGAFGVLARHAEQRADLERMRGLAEAAGDDRRLSDALNGLADSYNRTGDLAATRTAAEAALAIKARLGDRGGEADALSNIAPLYAALGDFEAAKAANRRALEIREAIGAERGQIRSLDNLGVNHLYVGEFTVARGYFEQALARARAVGYKGYELQATIHVAAASAQLGEAERARACGERALALAREMGDQAIQGWAWLLLGWAETDEGRLEAAEQACERALELARATGSNELEVRTLNWLGHSLLFAGRPAEALARLEQGAELAEAAGFTLDLIHTLAGAAAAALDDGQPELARSRAERALAALGSIEPGVLQEGQYVAWCLYRVLRALGDERAEPFREQARAIVRRRADAIGEPGRQLYLRRPFIRAIMEEQERRTGRSLEKNPRAGP